MLMKEDTHNGRTHEDNVDEATSERGKRPKDT